jgi:putative SOS response-associated peptidase YedK
MCGRFVAPDTAAIEAQWRLRPSETALFERRFNVAPTAEVPVIRPAKDREELELARARWGLVPHWWTQARPPRFNHNARLEEAAAKPMWRDALRRWRCIVPAIGWYEWRESDRQPFYFRRSDGRLAALAGLLSFHPQQGLTFAVLSTAAQDGPEAIHHRMPVILAPEAEAAWLESGAVQTGAAAIAFHAVRRLVNNARAEGPELLEPA